jgi:hypothetical protein
VRGHEHLSRIPNQAESGERRSRRCGADSGYVSACSVDSDNEAVRYFDLAAWERGDRDRFLVDTLEEPIRYTEGKRIGIKR